MSWCALALASLCTLGALSARAVAGPEPQSAVRFAIVIGNNQPESERAGILRFADDDALATHRLLVEAGVHSVLLARFDDTTRKLHPVAQPDGLPRWPDLQAALGRLGDDMRRERAAGRAVELLVFYSGHGDVAHGEGYVLLEDRHLTRSALGELLDASPATWNHVIIDACKSYFMAFEKGPGGRRARFAGGFFDPARPSAGHLANTGFVLSTSSDRDSHEWERFQGGVFSHQVRSALRGAADADGDGRISYAELGAFLTTASQAIVNPRFRPDFLVRPPAGTAANLSATLLRWTMPVSSAVLLDDPVGHVYVETANGERVLDAHAAVREPVTLRVPDERPLFVRRDDGSGREYVVVAGGQVRVSEIEGKPISVASRGAAHLAFEQLFATPFGRDSVRRFTERWTPESSTAQAGSDDDPRPGSTRSVVETASGVATLGFGALAAVTSIVMVEQYETGRSATQADRVDTNRTLGRLGIAAAITASVALASGAVWLAVHRGPSAGGDGTQLAVVPAAGDAVGVTMAIERSW
jgi:hypothetical protein